MVSGEGPAFPRAVGDLFGGGSENVSWEQALSGLGAQDAVRMPLGLPHSVARIVAHVVFWQGRVLEGAGGTLLTSLEGYGLSHLGQVVTTRQALGPWPPPEGGFTW